MSNETWYDVLGVAHDATEREIRKAYLRLSLRHHPDRHSDEDAKAEAQRVFVKLVNAYEILGDENRRIIYDSDLRNAAAAEGDTERPSHEDQWEDARESEEGQWEDARESEEGDKSDDDEEENQEGFGGNHEDAWEWEEEEKKEEEPEVEEDEQDDEVPICCVCYGDAEPSLACSGSTNQHHLCSDCLQQYIRTEIQHDGAYRAIRQQQRAAEGNAEPLTSVRGQLPCPQFLSGDCDCAAIPDAVLFAAMRNNIELSTLFMRAFRDVIQLEADLANQERGGNNNNNDDEADTNEDANANAAAQEERDLERIRLRVETALTDGGEIRCPTCRLQGIKDSACMHISCPGCSARWCYCCGRRRSGADPLCRGCDTNNAYIENNPGWGGFAHDGESAGFGALFEFHRRIMAYYVRRVKDETDPALWDRFVETHPAILQNVGMNENRFILWEELDTATPPLFGPTTEDDLMWKLPPLRRRPAAPANNANDINRPNHDVEAQQELESFWAPLSTFWGQLWIGGITIASILMIVRVALEDPSVPYQSVSGLCLGVMVTLFFRYAALWTIEWFRFHPDNSISWKEVQVVGSEDTPPYLSSIGRWSHLRQVYIGILVWGLFGGSWLCLWAERKHYGFRAFKCLGAFVITVVGLGCILLTGIENRETSPTPNDANDFDLYRKLLIHMGSLTFLASAGVGLLSIGIRGFGIFLLVLSTCAIITELGMRELTRPSTVPFRTPMERDLGRRYHAYAVAFGTFVSLLIALL